MNILFLNKFNERWKGKYRDLKSEFPQIEFTATYDPNERLDAIRVADVIVTGRLYENEIEQAEKLRAIFVPFTGLDTFPVELIISKGINIFNTHANARYVAEHAVALMFALLGRVVEFHNDLKQGFWHRTIEDTDFWTTIHAKTVGIAGLGHIGHYIAKFIKQFDCKIVGFKENLENPYPELFDEITNDITILSLKSDVLFVCLPLNNETNNIITSEILHSMRGKYLINVGRGETVNEEGLYNALKDGILAGAALDVWYNYPGKNKEPIFPAHLPIYELPNVVLSPHKSSHTIEAINAMIDDTAENIRKYFLDFTC